MNLLIVGINPSQGNPKRVSGTIKRLNRWVDYFNAQHFSFTNIIHTPGPYKSDMIDYNILNSFTEGYDKVIALGGFVSKTLNTAGIEHFMMPHPSPLNRQLNDKEFEMNKLKECKEWLKSS